MYRTALKQVAKEALETANIYLSKLDPNKHECLLHLHLEAIQTNPAAFGNRLPALVANQWIFDAGFDGAKWLSFALACHESFPHLNALEKRTIEILILNYQPELKRAIRLVRKLKQYGKNGSSKDRILNCLNESGKDQWNILETIGEELLGKIALAYLQELRRKFPKKEMAKPFHVEIHERGSPIKRENCVKMKDHHWLSAIKRYDNERQPGRNRGAGGAEQLAGELQEATKNDPMRFSSLCLRIPDSTQHIYVEHILEGLAEATAPAEQSLMQAVKYAHRHPAFPLYLLSIAWVGF